MDNIIEYLKERYMPLSIIVYGSYANKTNNSSSDFDALVICDNVSKQHDTSIIDNIQLDVFIFSPKHFENSTVLQDFLHISSGVVVFDTNNFANNLLAQIKELKNNLLLKDRETVVNDIRWCRKMYHRIVRNDAEAMFRWHWVLTDSLEIFFDAIKCFYEGPKKALTLMKAKYPEAYLLYSNALFELDLKLLDKWITYLENIEVS